jgi:hypothetical protein
MYHQKKQFFSERNGYKMPAEQLALESVPEEVENAILSAFTRLLGRIAGPFELSPSQTVKEELCEYLWTHFFHKELSTLRSDHFMKAEDWIRKEHISSTTPWHIKLGFVEAVIDIANSQDFSKYYIRDFVTELNGQFETLSYGYRIIKGNVIEITSELEKKAIETAIDKGRKPVKEALQQALVDHCARPEANYAGSMKNSLSAVEIECCRLTGESTLGPALSKLKKNGIAIHSQLEAAFQNLYRYSNDEKTGIRHGKKVNEDTFVPGAKESLFMLVTCSAFINYRRSCEMEREA